MVLHRLRTRAFAVLALNARQDDDVRRVLRVLDQLATLSQRTGTDALGVAVIDWYEQLRQHLFAGAAPASVRVQTHWAVHDEIHQQGTAAAAAWARPVDDWAAQLLHAYMAGDDDRYLAVYREAWAAPGGGFIDHVLAALDLCALTIRERPYGCALQEENR